MDIMNLMEVRTAQSDDYQSYMDSGMAAPRIGGKNLLSTFLGPVDCMDSDRLKRLRQSDDNFISDREANKILDKDDAEFLFEKSFEYYFTSYLLV